MVDRLKSFLQNQLSDFAAIAGEIDGGTVFSFAAGMKAFFRDGLPVDAAIQGNIHSC